MVASVNSLMFTGEEETGINKSLQRTRTLLAMVAGLPSEIISRENTQYRAKTSSVFEKASFIITRLFTFDSGRDQPSTINLYTIGCCCLV